MGANSKKYKKTNRTGQAAGGLTKKERDAIHNRKVMKVLLPVAPGSTQTAVVTMANKGKQISIALDAESMAWVFGYFSAEERLAKITMREELRDASKCCVAFDRCKGVFFSARSF